MQASVGIFHDPDPMVHFMGDDDPFLFSADQLEEELNTANSELFLNANEVSLEEDRESTEGDSVPSLETTDSESSGRGKRKRKPTAKAQQQQEQQHHQDDEDDEWFEPQPQPKTKASSRSRSRSKSKAKKPEPVSIVVPEDSTPAPELVPTPASSSSTSTSKSTKERKPPAKRRRNSGLNKKYEPLAPQVIPSRANRAKLFTWADRMVQLAEYKAKFGHVAIPTVRRDPYYNLGLWLAAQRSLYRKNTLKKERLTELRELGCVGFGGRK